MNKHFAKGSGCYVCRVCKRNTRAVDDDSHHLRLCFECFEVAGIENEISDCGDPDDKLAKEIDALNNACVAKGGKIEGYPKAPGRIRGRPP